jgi:hypothetical protein
MSDFTAADRVEIEAVRGEFAGGAFAQLLASPTR